MGVGGKEDRLVWDRGAHEPAVAPERERRAATRWASDAERRVTVRIASTMHQGRVVDYAAGGARIELDRDASAVPVHELEAELGMPDAIRIDGWNVRSIHATLVWHGISADGARLIGVTFAGRRHIEAAGNRHATAPAPVTNVRHRSGTDVSVARALSAMSQLLWSDRFSLESALSMICEQARELVAAEGVSFWRLEGQVVVASAFAGRRWGKEGTRLTLQPDSSLIGDFAVLKRRIQAGEQLFTNDLSSSPRAHHPWVERLGMQSAMIVPVFGREMDLGLLVFGDSRNPYAFSERSQRVAEGFAHQAALLLENARMVQGVREWSEYFRAMNRITLALHERLDVDRVLDAICEEGRKLFRVDVAVVFLREGDDFVQRAAAGTTLRRRRVARSEVVIPEAQLSEQGKGFFINGIDEHALSRQPIFRQSVGRRPPQSLMTVPIMDKASQLGSLTLIDCTNRNRFSTEDLEKGALLGEQAALALANAQLYEQLAKSKEILRRQDRFHILGALAGTVSHEVKNALVPLRTVVDLLPQRYEDEHFRRWYTETVRTELDRMFRLVSQLNHFRRVEKRVPQSVYPLELLRGLAELVRPEAVAHRVTIEVASADRAPIRAIVSELRQVFLNLILNAIEAMPDGGIVRLAAADDAERRGVEFLVSDTGEGIPPERLETIFDPLYTTREHGSGLGLAVARDLVRAHDGSISVESVAGRGTTFAVFLPCEPSFSVSPSLVLATGDGS
jgi:signal transduction histidine kinase